MGERSSRISGKWLKAAVLGSLWAAIEIIAGSFLHNIRLPFAGTMLSMFSVFMLVAFMRHWKEPGVILRAGVVAALMKSISPSAVILGPMIAIVMEAVILEFVTRILGRHLFSYLLAGAMAVMWALLQKILNFIVLYGFDLIRVAEAFYQWVVLKTGLDQVTPSLLVIIVAGSYALAGILAAVMGYLTFRRPEDKEYTDIALPARKRSGYLQQTAFNNYNAFHILFIILAVIITLFVTDRTPVWIYLPTGLVFLTYVLARYRRTTRYLRKPGIWIQFTLLTLIATLLWEWLSTGQYFSMGGLEIGLKMIFRAMVIIFGFSALSVELRNPLIRSILHRNGLSNLYIALNLSFTALPFVMDRLPGFRTMIRQKKRLIVTMIGQADLLLNKFTEESMPRDNVFLLTGPTQSGKTTLIRDTAGLLMGKGMKVRGILAPGNFQDGKRNEFFCRDISSGKEELLSSRKPEKGWIPYGPFFFNPEIFAKGTATISNALKENADLVILDEVGPVEMKGKGWHQALELLKDRRDILQVWVVRERMMKEIRLNYMVPAENVIRTEQWTAEGLTEFLSVD